MPYLLRVYSMTVFGIWYSKSLGGGTKDRAMVHADLVITIVKLRQQVSDFPLALSVGH